MKLFQKSTFIYVILFAYYITVEQVHDSVGHPIIAEKPDPVVSEMDYGNSHRNLTEISSLHTEYVLCHAPGYFKVETNTVSPRTEEDNGTVENALLNYLYALQYANRLRHQMDVRDLQRKRSYWKQCAFNAVSCFG